MIKPHGYYNLEGILGYGCVCMIFWLRLLSFGLPETNRTARDSLRVDARNEQGENKVNEVGVVKEVEEVKMGVVEEVEKVEVEEGEAGPEGGRPAAGSATKPANQGSSGVTKKREERAIEKVIIFLVEFYVQCTSK